MPKLILTIFLASIIVPAACRTAATGERGSRTNSTPDATPLATQTPSSAAGKTDARAPADGSTQSLKEQKTVQEESRNPTALETKAASAEFKSQPYNRQHAAKKLLPLIKTGTTMERVEALLGEPNTKTWDYSLFYSMVLSIRFDAGEKVAHVSSDVTGETAEADIEDPETKAASAEFKSQPYNRQHAAKKLLPLIKTGTTMERVEALLGEPSSKTWDYGLNTGSSSLVVSFDSEQKVRRVVPVGLD